MRSSLKDTEVKVLRAKALRFLTVLYDPVLKSRVIEILQMSYTQQIIS
ncbi:MAG: hypothetical protein WC271_15075 [Bacteroidales bacterium]|jgi:hypothetical protein|nr:hypothetical protein [Bacteroidales bacterium]MDD2631577.1 hypothetical protein [Bacteroidales bacterium]MDD3131341.1 hypothetical protein [Bacteroidales bacterium]MDD4178277.1 hypothetical protein [Bacteroidales bacterium]MDD4742635.1 hypothetical protein [Bacteroidales bacterium]